MGKFKSTKPGGAILRPKLPIRKNILTSDTVPIQRQARVNPVRGASVNRSAAREIRRNNFQQTVQQVNAQPRFVVRPAGPAVKIMPKTPIPMQAIKRPIPVRPIAPPVTAQKIASKPLTNQSSEHTGFAKPTIKSKLPLSNPVFQRPAGVISHPARAIGAASLAALVINVAAANQEISVETNSVNLSLEELKTGSSLSDVLDDVNRLDNDLLHALDLLESARKEGYVYQKDIEEILYKDMDRWQIIKPELLTSIPNQSELFQNKMLLLGVPLASLNRSLNNPSAATPLLRDTTSRVNSLSTELTQIKNSFENKISDIRDHVNEITSRLNLIHWSMDQVNQAKITFGNTEMLIHAVPARWDQEGDQDPEGVLYLTNQRVIFERKEKIATKKILFITTASEIIQEVLIDQPIETCTNEKALHKGLFGNQDFLELSFSNALIKDASFHLNGQDCKLWVTWIQKVKSGDIESERTSGSGLSFTDITGPLTHADILAIQTEVNALQDNISLMEVRNELSKIENDLSSLERNLSTLRARGYAIEKSLESDIKVLALQWDRIRTNAEIALQNQANLLNEQMTQIHQNLAMLLNKSSNLDESRPLYLQIKSEIASTEAQADAADDTIMITYDQYADEVEKMEAHLEWVSWMLDALATASFKLLATESGIAATEATHVMPGSEPENGILFLTDQRLLWEDRVDDYQLKIDLPLKLILDVKREVDTGNNVESLIFELDRGAPDQKLVFSLSLPIADAWLKMIGRARSGEYATDRAIEIDPIEIERIRNAPRQCSNCGAGFVAPILRGQTELTCEYCSQVTRI